MYLHDTKAKTLINTVVDYQQTKSTSKRVLASIPEVRIEYMGIRNIEKSIVVFVLLVDTAHKSGSRRKDFIDKDEDGLLGSKLDALTDDIAKLANGQV
jgi:hypothetical protein